MISIDLATLIAVITGTFAIMGVIIALFLWLRGESNADRRCFQEIQKEDRKDLLQISRNMELEMKDFHLRLLEIERARLSGK